MSAANVQSKVNEVDGSERPDPNSAAGVMALLGNAAPFHDLPDAVLKTIAEISDVRTYAGGETIAAMGQYDASEFFLVLSGVLKACQIDPASGSVVIEETSDGGMFGLAQALTGSAEQGFDSVSLTAGEDVEVLTVEADAFRQIVAQRPTLTRNLMLYFAGLIAKGALRAVSAEASPEQRVYAALLEYVELAGPAGPWEVKKMPKHRELADRAGADETLTAQAIAQIIHDGVVRRNYPGLIVDDIDRLKQLSV